MKSRRWCTVGNTKKILIAVWIVAIALSSPTFKILVNISLFVNMFSMKWPGSDGNERKYIVNHGNIYHKLAKSSVKSGQHLPWTGKISREMRAISTLDWQTIMWNEGNIYLELAKSSVKSGQHLPWASKIVREIRANFIINFGSAKILHTFSDLEGRSAPLIASLVLKLFYQSTYIGCCYHKRNQI